MPATRQARRTFTQVTPTKIAGIIPFAASQKVTMQRLDRTMYYRSLNLRLTGSITTTGTSTTANLAPGDEWGCVALIELVANGGNVIRSITGEQLVILNYLFQGYIKQINTLVGVAGTYAFDSTIPLWMILPNGLGKNIDTTLNATVLSDLFIRITWGSALSINALASTTISATTQIEVSADNAFFLDRTIIPPFSLTQMQSYTFQNIPQTAAGTQGYQYQIPVGQTYIAMLLNAKNNGTTQDNAIALTGNGVIQSGTNQLYNMDFVTEAAMNNYRRYIPFFRFTDFLNNTKNLFAAWRLIIFPKQVNLTESLNLINFQNCNFFVQNADTNAIDLTVIPLTIFPTKQVVSG